MGRAARARTASFARSASTRGARTRYRSSRTGRRPRAAWSPRAAYAKPYRAPEPVWGALRHAKAPYDILGKALFMEVDLAKVAPAKPGRSIELRKQAEEHLKRGEYQLALADAELAHVVDPADGTALFLRAECFAELGLPEAAPRDLETAELLAPHRRAEIAAARKALAAKAGSKK